MSDTVCCSVQSTKIAFLLVFPAYKLAGKFSLVLIDWYLVDKLTTGNQFSLHNCKATFTSFFCCYSIC